MAAFNAPPSRPYPLLPANVTPPSPPLRLHYIPTNDVLPKAYDVEDLVDTAISSFWRKDLSRDQWAVRQLLDALKYWRTRWRYEDYMMELIKLLCKIFGLGDSSRIVFEWDEKLRRERPIVWGYCDAISSSRKVKIVMDLRAFAEQEIVEHKGAMLSVLLHELCHALIEGWACQGGACGQSECMQKDLGHFGVQGHGKAWFLLASHVEIAARKFAPATPNLAEYPRQYTEGLCVGRDGARCAGTHASSAQSFGSGIYEAMVELG